jgi:methyltransferase (TIGR00027 family)
VTTSTNAQHATQAGSGLKPKRSAEGNAVLRYAGSLDRRPDIRNPDRLAGLFLGPKFRTLAGFTPLRRAALPIYMRLFPGAYYYQIARTKLFDAVLLDRIGSGAAQQLVILGAGYDTRAQRFSTTLADVPTFEVDYPATLTRKLEKLQAAPGNTTTGVIYVSADFNKDDWRTKLRDAGFDDSLATLVLWEGVCMFINQAAVDDTLHWAAGLPAGSSILFDYVVEGALQSPGRYLGGRQVARYMQKGDEPWIFAIEHDDVEQWLRAHDLQLVSLRRPADLEREFLASPHGERQVLAIHGVAHAGVPTEGAS